jgi:hypothetical protein
MEKPVALYKVAQVSQPAVPQISNLLSAIRVDWRPFAVRNEENEEK